jgi:hypothetical protein
LPGQIDLVLSLVSTFAGSTAASLSFAGMIAVFALAVLYFGMRYLPR